MLHFRKESVQYVYRVKMKKEIEAPIR